MHLITTTGSWHDLGAQYGEQLRDPLRSAMERLLPRWAHEQKRLTPVAKRFRSMAAMNCPELLEETAGMSETSGIEEPQLIALRFIIPILDRQPQHCSVIYMAESDHGPLLGRNCDMEPWLAPLQVCQINRPTNAWAGIYTGIVGSLVRIGVNERGLAFGGSSTNTRHAHDNDEGISTEIITHLLYQKCAKVIDAQSLLTKQSFNGNPSVSVIGDGEGASAILELVPGQRPVVISRPQDRDWNAATNFFHSRNMPFATSLAYRQNSYARYGRIAAQLDSGHTERSLSGMKQLLGDVAQSNFCCDGQSVGFVTAYSQICVLNESVMYVSTDPSSPESFWKVQL